MKVVKEYINEKFIQNSDPIKDLGIGNPFYSINPPILIIAKKRVKISGLVIFNKGEGGVIYEIFKKNNNILKVEMVPFSQVTSSIINTFKEDPYYFKEQRYGTWETEETYEFWDDHFIIYKG